MTRERLPFLFAVAVLIVFIGLGSAGIWWYLFGPNEVDSAELVPGNTIAFANIPNGAAIVEGFASSNAKAVLDSPNIKPLHDYLVALIGQKTSICSTHFFRTLAASHSSLSPILTTIIQNRSDSSPP